MLFNSYIFWAFFIIVIILYWNMRHKIQNRMLLIASYIFYGAWNWRFLSLLLISTIVDYFVGIRLGREQNSDRRKYLLWVSTASNLGILGVFKYYGFFIEEFNSLFHLIGLPVLLPTIDVILPVGISFYTFQTMSYTIDVYRGETKPVHEFLDFALYVSFFPQLVAGPIERSFRLIPQILQPRSFSSAQFSEGFYLIIFGLFKKIVIADNMAAIVNTIFGADPHSLTGVEVLVGVYAFAFQIYGDFSGYSSIACGLARWMGIDLMVNFRMPYLAVSPSDFWGRWHISLSSWLRDYLYIPLGGSHGGTQKTYRNLMLTMLLGGLWHGAAWTFVVWGFFHGLILCIYRIIENTRKSSLASACANAGFFLPQRLGLNLLMFHLVCLGWLFFRAESMMQVWVMLHQIITAFESTDFAWGALSLVLFYTVPLIIYEIWVEKNNLFAITLRPFYVQGIFYNYCFLMLLFFPSPTQHEFIYFQF